MSEYLGIRLAMLDGLQRYYKTPDTDKMDPAHKVQLMQSLIKQACKEDGLLEHGDVTGEAWSRLLGARPASAVVSFLDNKQIHDMATGLPELKPLAHDMTNTKAALLVAKNAKTLTPLVTSFEDIAQKTGLIDYKGGDTLSANIEKYTKQINAEHGQSPAPKKEENQAQIKELFASHNGQVEDQYLNPAQPQKKPKLHPGEDVVVADGDSLSRIAMRSPEIMAAVKKGLQSVGDDHSDDKKYVAKIAAGIIAEKEGNDITVPDKILSGAKLTLPTPADIAAKFPVKEMNEPDAPAVNKTNIQPKSAGQSR